RLVEQLLEPLLDPLHEVRPVLAPQQLLTEPLAGSVGVGVQRAAQGHPREEGERHQACRRDWTWLTSSMSNPSLRKRWSTYCSTAMAPANGPMIAPETTEATLELSRRPTLPPPLRRPNASPAPRSANGTAITWLTITVARKARRKTPRIRQNWPRASRLLRRRASKTPRRSTTTIGAASWNHRTWIASAAHRASSTTNRPSSTASTRPAALSDTATPNRTTSSTGTPTTETKTSPSSRASPSSRSRRPLACCQAWPAVSRSPITARVTTGVTRPVTTMPARKLKIDAIELAVVIPASANVEDSSVVSSPVI